MSSEIGVTPIISLCDQMHFLKMEWFISINTRLTTNSKYTKLSPNEVQSKPNKDQSVAY